MRKRVFSSCVLSLLTSRTDAVYSAPSTLRAFYISKSSAIDDGQRNRKRAAASTVSNSSCRHFYSHRSVDSLISWGATVVCCEIKGNCGTYFTLPTDGFRGLLTLQPSASHGEGSGIALMPHKELEELLHSASLPSSRGHEKSKSAAANLSISRNAVYRQLQMSENVKLILEVTKMSEQEKKTGENIAKKTNELDPKAQEVVLAFAQGMVAGMKQNSESK